MKKHKLGRPDLSGTKTCTRCGISSTDWWDQGYEKDCLTYCCDECASKSGCKCGPSAKKKNTSPRRSQ